MNKLGIFLITAALISYVASDSSGSYLCPDFYSPVCGSDGKTYSNECLLKHEKSKTNSDLKIVKQGSCSKIEPCVCNLDYSPICGTNGVTYANECVLNCVAQSDPSLTMKHYGPCENNVDLAKKPAQ